MRKVLTIAMIVGGVVLMIVSYFFLSTPWGTTAEKFSNPRTEYATTLFILGVLIAFLAPVVYELLPDRHEKGPPAS